jgi:E3 ubiquitin-protein ligase RGLG
MGIQSSKPMGTCSSKIIYDRFTTLPEIQHQLRLNGLESCDLIIGIDYTKSNLETGRNSFGGRSLHTISIIQNPYQYTIDIICRTLDRFDDDHLIPVFGFGDLNSRNETVFPLKNTNSFYCNGLPDVLTQYQHITPTLTLSGPTTFSPLIKTAVNIVKQTGRYHILLIITDGAVSNPDFDAETIIEASNYGLSIVCIGVGDGPFDTMHTFDDKLHSRKFDNFQFVELNKLNRENIDIAFAVSALQEIPDQYKYIKDNGLLKSFPRTNINEYIKLLPNQQSTNSNFDENPK